MSVTIAETPPFFPVQERQIGNFSVDSVTSAPLQIEVSVELNISQEKAFELVFADLESWTKEISDIVWNNEKSTNGPDLRGLNSTRVCGFDGKQLFETIAFYDAPNAYGYVIDLTKSTATFPVKDPLGIFLVEAVSPNKSIVTWRQYFNKRFHPLALIIKPMVRNMLMKRNMKKGLIDKFGGRFVN